MIVSVKKWFVKLYHHTFSRLLGIKHNHSEYVHI